MYPILEQRLRGMLEVLPDSLRRAVEIRSSVVLDDPRVTYEELMVALQVTVELLKAEQQHHRKKDLINEFTMNLVEGARGIAREYFEVKHREIDAREGYTRAVRAGLEGITEQLGGLNSQLGEVAEEYLGLTQQRNYIEERKGQALERIGSGVGKVSKTLEKQLAAASTNNKIMQGLVESLKRIHASPVPENEISSKIRTTRPKYSGVANCVYQNAKVPSPQRCVQIFDDGESTSLICLIPNQAYKRTFLGWQWLSGDTLKNQGCPLHDSRGLIERFFPGNRCPLADGKLHRMDIKYGEGSIWPLSG